MFFSVGSSVLHFRICCLISLFFFRLEFFNVDPGTGRITVKNGDLLDREGRSFYSANLQAKDKANNTGTAILEITLLDKNDNAPKMIRESYIAFVNEGPGVNLKLQIQVSDV